MVNRKISLFFVLLFLMTGMTVAVENDQEILSSFGNSAGFDNEDDLQRTPGGAYNFVKGEDNKEGIILTVPAEGKLKYKDSNGEFREFLVSDRENKFIFKNGDLLEADFEISKNSKICTDSSCKSGAIVKLGDYKYEVSTGSKISYKKGSAEKKDSIKIIMPNQKEIVPPKFNEKSDEKNKGNAIVQYDTKGDSLKLPNDNLISKYEFKGKKQKLELFYDTNERAFYMEGSAVVSGIEVGTIESKKTFLMTEGKDFYKEPYGDPILFLDKEKDRIVAFTPAGKEGPSLKLNKNNIYGGIKMGENDNLIIQAHGTGNTLEGKKEKFSDAPSSIIISTKKGDIPKIVTRGAYTIVDGDRLIRWNDKLKNGPRVWPIKSIDIKEDNGGTQKLDFTKTDAVVLDIKSYEGIDKDGEYIDIKFKGVKGEDKKVDFDMFVSKEGDVTVGRDKEIEVRNKVAFNNLKKAERDKFLKLPYDEQVKRLGGKKEDLTKGLENIKTEPPKTEVNPSKEEVEEETKNPTREAELKRLVKTDIGNLLTNDISKNYFQKKFDPTKHKVVVFEFGNTKPGGCPACRHLKDDMEALGRKDVLFAHTVFGNIDKFPYEFNEGGMPAYVVFVDGKKVSSTVGYNKGSISSILSRYK